MPGRKGGNLAGSESMQIALHLPKFQVTFSADAVKPPSKTFYSR
jgi:hypothetical protein